METFLLIYSIAYVNKQVNVTRVMGEWLTSLHQPW